MCAACVQQVEGAVSATALLASLALSTLVFVVGSQRVPQSHQQYVVPVGLLCTVALNRAVVAGSVLSALLLSVVQAPLLFLAVAAVVVLLRRGVVTRSVEGGVDDGADGATPPMPDGPPRLLTRMSSMEQLDTPAVRALTNVWCGTRSTVTYVTTVATAVARAIHTIALAAATRSTELRRKSALQRPLR
jgi:hypothetical protein